MAPEAALFVDDSIANVTGAQAAGLTGLVFEGAAGLATALVARGLMARQDTCSKIR